MSQLDIYPGREVTILDPYSSFFKGSGVVRAVHEDTWKASVSPYMPDGTTDEDGNANWRPTPWYNWYDIDDLEP